MNRRIMFYRKAATASIQSLQYISNYDSNNNKLSHQLSHGEEMAILAELRAYITSLGAMDKVDRSSTLDRTINLLYELGNTILAPLQLLKGGNNNNNTDEEAKKHTLNRSHNAYLLPLELIPVIFATMDVLDDIQMHYLVDKEHTLKFEEHDTTEMNMKEDKDMVHIRASDKFLSSTFATTCNYDSSKTCNNFQRTLRADALLPILSLAMDDIGFDRMSTTLHDNETVTYWDCLKYALSNVIHDNLICYIDDEAVIEGEDANLKRIVVEATSDEGIHIIPSSDYPALIRCIFRMVSTGVSSSSEKSIIIPCWERLLLQLYHATVVATNQMPLPLIQQRKGGADRLALLSTVESHVLLPSCTGAAVSTIRSILEVCNGECCITCGQGATEIIDSKQHVCIGDVVPAWAVAGVVLLIMRARSSYLSHGVASTRGFGPRAVFRMASDILLRKATKENDSNVKSNKSSGVGSDDEIGYSLKALLHLSSIRGGTCHECCDENLTGINTEKSAYDVLKYCYYAGNDNFRQRYTGSGDDKFNCSYQHELGLHALSSYSNLVRTSLNHGAIIHNTWSTQSINSSKADTARTWIDAANMLLDASDNTSTDGKSSSNIQYGAAMAIVAIVVVFFEFPPSQDDIVRSIYGRLESMACRSSQSIGKQSEKSCFVLISVLAWSLAANYGKHLTNNNIVRRKDQRDDTSTLGPLCNLLSKTALSRDNGGASRLSYWAISQLASALSPCLAGQDVILAIAQKYLGALSILTPYSTSSAKYFESLSTTPSNSNDAVYLAVHCLILLVETRSDHSSADDCSRRALGMITDVIVLQGSCFNTAPRLPINVISWMLSKLNKSAREGKLTNWESQRLFRACLVGLLNSIVLEEEGSEPSISILIPAHLFSMIYSSVAAPIYRMKIDVPGMLRLAVTLYDIILRNDILQRSNKLLKSHLIQTLLNPSANLTVQANGGEINQLFKEIQQVVEAGFNPKNDALSIDGVSLVIIVQSVAKMIQKKRAAPSSSTGGSSALVRSFVRYISEAEKHSYLNEGDGVSVQKHGPSLPTWIKDQQYEGNSGVVLDDALMNCAEFKRCQMSFCNILIEILLQKQTHQPMDNQEDEKLMLLGVNSILRCKRRIKTQSSASENSFGDLPCRLIELTSQRLRPLLTTSANKMKTLSDIDTLVANALDFCDNVQSNKSLKHGPSRSRILRSCWALHCSLTDEESSQLLISFVKEAFVDKGEWAEQGTTDISADNFTLLGITGSGDLDFHVRYVREIVLSALAQILTSMATLKDKNSESPDERKSNLDLLLQVMPHLCQDLDSAFLGASGGVTKQLVMHFLNAIEGCVDAIDVLFDSIPNNARHEMPSSLFLPAHQSAVIIWEILREHPLRQASILKHFLRLCIDKISSLLRKVERAIDACIVAEPPIERTCDLLEQCSAILMAKPAEKKDLEDKSTSPSAADNTRANDAKIDSNSEARKEESEEDQILLSSNENSKQDTNISDIGDGKVQVCNITTAENLSWICHCSLVSASNVWNDSYRQLVSSSGRSRIHTVNSPLSDKSVALASRRIDGFSRLHSSICRMFETMAPNSEESVDDVSTTILAELLSYHGKSNMCTCIEKMTMALILAFKQVIKYVNEPLSTANKTLSNELKLRESLVCTLGLLQSVKTKETTHNLITGTISWYVHEEKKFSKSYIMGKEENEGYPILGRLPKVLLRLEGLDNEIRKLDTILQVSSVKDEANRQRILKFKELVSVFFKGKDESAQFDFSGSLRQFIENVNISKKVLKGSEADDSLLSDEKDSEEDDLEEDKTTGKRQRQRYTPVRKSRKVSLRSRNETIDNWLAIDDEEFATTTGEKYNSSDAFVDLEDFLVEG